MINAIKVTKYRRMRSQAAIDFITSYGIVIIFIVIALYVALQLGVFNPNIVQPSCTSAPSFTCIGVIYTVNGIAEITMSQETGGPLYISGVGCATTANTIGNYPQYGNAELQSNSIAPAYYPDNSLASGLVMSSGSAVYLDTYCFDGSGVAITNRGAAMTGYLWINYTYNSIPSTYRIRQQVIQFTAITT
ncbi:MAG: hypothetical protein M1504_02490 [Candidatus Marsarchaeota archaeon]|nr:hypothetical protein [Candidatus Marsarchaeota archaeon]